jgi:hypothetical protein
VQQIPNQKLCSLISATETHQSLAWWPWARSSGSSCRIATLRSAARLSILLVGATYAMPGEMVLTFISGSIQPHKTSSTGMMLLLRSVSSICLLLHKLTVLGNQLEKIGVKATASVNGQGTRSSLWGGKTSSICSLVTTLHVYAMQMGPGCSEGLRLGGSCSSGSYKWTL